MLIAGLYSRYASQALIPALLGSIIFARLSAGWLFSNEGGSYEYPLFLIAASIAQALLGDGVHSVKQLFKPRPLQPTHRNHAVRRYSCPIWSLSLLTKSPIYSGIFYHGAC